MPRQSWFRRSAVVINIELQGPAMSQKGGRQEIKVGEQEFALVEFGAGEQAANLSGGCRAVANALLLKLLARMAQGAGWFCVTNTRQFL
jgi:hypothetical protein